MIRFERVGARRPWVHFSLHAALFLFLLTVAVDSPAQLPGDHMFGDGTLKASDQVLERYPQLEPTYNDAKRKIRRYLDEIDRDREKIKNQRQWERFLSLFDAVQSERERYQKLLRNVVADRSDRIDRILSQDLIGVARREHAVKLKKNNDKLDALLRVQGQLEQQRKAIIAGQDPAITYPPGISSDTRAEIEVLIESAKRMQNRNSMFSLIRNTIVGLVHELNAGLEEIRQDINASEVLISERERQIFDDLEVLVLAQGDQALNAQMQELIIDRSAIHRGTYEMWRRTRD